MVQQNYLNILISFVMMMNDDIHFVYMIIHSDQSPAVIHRVIKYGKGGNPVPIRQPMKMMMSPVINQATTIYLSAASHTAHHTLHTVVITIMIRVRLDGSP